ELIGDVLPPCSFSSEVYGRLDGGYVCLVLSKKGCPAGEDGCALDHAGLQVHWAHMLNDRAAGLLWTKAAGDILPTLPGTSIDRPSFRISTILQPPTQVGCGFRIEPAQPVQITRSAHNLVATPKGKTPGRGGAANPSIIGNHVIAPILAHAGKIRMGSRLKM